MAFDALTMQNLAGLNSRRAWSVWFVAVILTVGIHCSTLTFYPPIMSDEVQILEYGRAMVSPGERDWSTNWQVTGRPALVPYYLGCTLEELALRLAGGSNAGPRLFSLLGAVFAGTAMMGWLLRRGSAPAIGLVCSLILLWDPLFTLSYRFVRLEGWVFGFIFTACWCIRIAATSEAGSLRAKGSALIAGACLALAGLFWASAILLLPLVFHEVLDPCLSGPVRTSWRIQLGVLLRLLVAGCAVFLMALLPVWPAVWTSIQDFRTDLTYNFNMAAIIEPVLRVFACFKHSPWIPAIGIISLLRPRCRMLGLCFLVALAGVSMTSPYTNRVVYLLPYLVLAAALLADTALSESPHSTRHRLVVLGLALALVWASLVTLCGGHYTWGALYRREATSPDRIMEVARQVTGPGAARVYVDTFEFYYAGRETGVETVPLVR